MDEFRFQLIAVPIAAGTASLVLLPALIRSRLLPQDRPNERSLHATPVPRSGGIALMVPALIAGWLVAPALHLVLACAAFLAFISFLDDLRPMPPLLRFLAHICAAAVLMFAALPQWPVAIALGVMLGVVWMTNLYNFMDGSDGLAGGMTVAGFACYAIVSAAADQSGLTILAASIAACALAFLLFNFHPARIFMGDIGSIPLGFLAAALGAVGWNEGLWSPLVPLLAFSPFIADATITLAKRLLAGEKVWLAHRNHYYQRVIRMGFGHRQTALAAYALMAGAAGSAIAIAGRPAAIQFSVTAAWAVAYLALAVAIDRRWQRHGEQT